MDRTLFPAHYLTWGQTVVEVMKIMVTSSGRSHAHTAALSAPNPVAGHRWPTPLLQTPLHARASLSKPLAGIAADLFSCVLVHTRFCLCPPRVCFPVLCKFWQLSGGVNGDLPQKGLCHTQVCCIQSPCPCSSPLLTHTFTGDTQTQFWLSLCGASASWCAQGLFELLSFFLSMSLAGLGFDSKHSFAPLTVLLVLLLCPWSLLKVASSTEEWIKKLWYIHTLELFHLT